MSCINLVPDFRTPADRFGEDQIAEILLKDSYQFELMRHIRFNRITTT